MIRSLVIDYRTSIMIKECMRKKENSIQEEGLEKVSSNENIWLLFIGKNLDSNLPALRIDGSTIPWIRLPIRWIPDESLVNHNAMKLEIERLLRAVVSQDIMSIVENNSVVDTLNLQTELEQHCCEDLIVVGFPSLVASLGGVLVVVDEF
nr:hypothetical protein [Tanacetum cinerariifolium]